MADTGVDHKRSPIGALTSLRFFAAFAVLFLHSGSHELEGRGLLPGPLGTFFANGYLGVSFFFVLSGFILTYVYLDELKGRTSLVKFYLARFARVYPVYLLSIILMTPLVAPTSFWLDAPQFILLQMWPPLGANDFLNWNGPAWTLSVELLFYLAFPALLALLAPLRASRVMVVAIILCVAMAAGRLSSISSISDAPFAFLGYIPAPVLRLPEFIFGICLALVYARGAFPTGLSWAPLAAIIATCGIIAASRSPWIAPFATIGFGLVIFSTAAWLRAGVMSRFLNSKKMLLLGGASYSLYLLQSPVRAWVRVILVGNLESIGRTCYLPIMICVSIVTFLRFEEPMRRWIKSLAATRVISAKGA